LGDDMRASEVVVVLIVVLDVVPIYRGACFFLDCSVSSFGILGGVICEPGSDGSVGDRVGAGGKVRAEGVGERLRAIFRPSLYQS